MHHIQCLNLVTYVLFRHETMLAEQVTGWFNLLGQVAVTASIVFTLTNHLASMILLGGGGAGVGYTLSQGQLLGVYGGEQPPGLCMHLLQT